jgi:transmembrane 9 superfamily member 2/4
LCAQVHADEAVAEHYVLNNHLRFKILYHKASADADASAWEGAADAQMGMYDYETMGAVRPHNYMKGNLIVGFTAAPYSIAHTFDGAWNKTCAPNCKLSTCLPGPEGGFAQHKPQRIDPAQGGSVIWTYDVVWEESDVKWASRWDIYLQMTDDKIHWFSIINSFVILLFLTSIVVMIFSRILRNDLSQYNAQDEEMDAAALREETGWKLLHGDVFRIPPAGMLLSVLVATGWQLLSMAASVLMLAALGFLSPSHRGSLLEAILLLYLLSGIAAGLVAARLAKLFAHEDRLRLTLYTALVFPAICTAIFLVINTVIWAHHSSMAVPFGTFMVVVLLWFVLSLPLVFLGAYMGFRQEVIALPCRTNQIPREIPPQQWYQTLVASMCVGGLLPFGAVFVELFFILSSIWQHRFYYMFGFLVLVFLVLVFSCAMISVILCYLHLCSEDYRWWWRSIWTGGATGIYLFAYGAYHYFARTHKVCPSASSPPLPSPPLPLALRFERG